MKCSEQGCAGEIFDGYCDTCGMPGVGLGSTTLQTPPQRTAPAPEPLAPASPTPHPATPASPPPPPPPSAPVSAAPAVPAVPGIMHAATPCQQPSCDGQVRDGYCDMCGAPEGSAPLTEAPLDSAPVTRVSQPSRISSTALGSARSSGVRHRGSSARLRTARLGAGLTNVPPAPPSDPLTALLKNPEVPENKRSCPHCGSPVGRSRDGKPGRTDGYCPNCRARYSFDPKLNPGDLVAGQYEVQGALAHGGMGWIYLAIDKNVSDRFVVLKGLLNSEDADLVASAITEQGFLAQVQHPQIVEIYNFVLHDGAGYIVMEYVGGRSLKQLLKDRKDAKHGVYDPLPVDQAISFIVELLPAFSYLHDSGLLFCDFKPDNVIQVGDALKLIDLGGVRRIGDDDSAIYGTVGYQAPEVSTDGPSIASDIYTIGRTLLVLCAEFKGYQSTYQFTIPSPVDMPVLARYDSLYRLLLKCCAPNPQDRFMSIDELRHQLMGVLREVVGAKTPGTSQISTSSLLFSAPLAMVETMDWHQLPTLRVDETDPAFSFLSTVNVDDPAQRLAVLNRPTNPSPEILLDKCRVALELGNQTLLQESVGALLAMDPWEWRAVWMAGLGAVAARDWPTAQQSFNAVYGQVPGELAPKLALALACEHGDQFDVAETLYAVCASTDANYVAPASFGLARIRLARGDGPGAMAALDMVPATSRGYSAARRMRAQHLVATAGDLNDLRQALRSVEQGRLDSETRLSYLITIYERALQQVKGSPTTQEMLGDVVAQPKSLRARLEQCYRELAADVTDPSERACLIEKANQIRPWSLL